MRSFAELSKTLGVLVALWAVLAAVGVVTGAFPTDAAPRTGAEDDAATATDGGVLAPEDAATEIAEDDAWTPEDDAGRLSQLALFAVCAAGDDVVWTLGDLAGDAVDELVVGCADHVEVLAWAGDRPSRIARFVPSLPARARGLAVGDVDADGRADLVLASDQGLFLVLRDEHGGFGTARVLAPSTNGAVALGELDASPGLDLAVVHGQDPRAELWIYHGGPTPQRASSTPAPLRSNALAVLDLDVDGHLDVVAAGAEQVLLAFGDSRAGVARTRSLTPGARGLALLRGQSLILERDDAPGVLAPSPALAEAAEHAPAPGLDPAVRALAATSDGLLGARHPDLVRWDGEALHVIATLATTRFGVHRLAQDARGLVLLGSMEDAPGTRTIVIARAPTDARLGDDEGRTDVVDAPLVLEVSLPDPDAP